MSRSSLTDPQPGDTFHSATFGGGATMTVTKRLQRKSKGQDSFEAVSVRWKRDDGRQVDPRGRTYAVVGLVDKFSLTPTGGLVGKHEC